MNKLLADPRPIKEQRYNNQSPAAVMRRALSQLGLHPGTVRNQMALANLSPAQLKPLYLGLMGLAAMGLVILCRRPGRELVGCQGSTEIALIVLATTWFSPVVWTYHFTAVTPALALVLSRNPPHKRLAWLAACIWGLGLGVLIIIGALLALARRSESGRCVGSS